LEALFLCASAKTYKHLNFNASIGLVWNRNNSIVRLNWVKYYFMRINIINTYLYKILYTDTMKARLNITIDKDVLQHVKLLADEQKTSVSELVENYFRTIAKPHKKKTFIELIKELPKPNLPEDFNWKDEYYQAKMKNNGL